jgi:signal transduction histidine kinase
MLDADRLQRLIAVGRDLVAELDLDSVLDQLLATAQELTGARYAAVGVLDERRSGLARFLTRGIDDRRRQAIGELPHGRGVLGLLITEPRTLRLDDVSGHPASYGFPPGHPPMTTFLGVPVLVRGEAWGNLYLTDKQDGFNEDDESAAEILAAWAAVAIHNARLYGNVQDRRDELERAVRGFEATASIARAVGGETDLARVLELISKRGRALVEARSVVILLREGQDLVVAASAGEGGADLREELGAEPTTLAAQRTDTALVVPLVYRSEALGLLAAVGRPPGAAGFTADDEEVFKAFAASAATAVATAQTVRADRLRRSMEAAEAERRRWARELHDETLQGLAGLKVLLAGARRLDDPAPMRDSIDAAVEHVGREIDNLRAIITDLRPAALDELGLVPALHTLGRRTAARAGLEMEVVLPEAGAGERFAAPVETTIYRLAQEGLTNVAKHAGARRARLALTVQDGTLVLEVADDGRGFDPQAPTPGFGVLGMRERVELAGGSLELARDDGWTILRAVVPLTD